MSREPVGRPALIRKMRIRLHINVDSMSAYPLHPSVDTWHYTSMTTGSKSLDKLAVPRRFKLWPINRISHTEAERPDSVPG